MSLQAFVWASGLPMDACSASSYRVLIVLADHAGPDGRNAFPDTATIATRLHCSRRTVERSLASLRALGLISYGDHKLVDHIRTDRRPKVYDVNLWWGVVDDPTELSLDDPTELSRPDRIGSNGPTTAVAHRTVLNRDTHYPAQPTTARTSDSRRECPNSVQGHRFEEVAGVERCMSCSMDRDQAQRYAEGER